MKKTMILMLLSILLLPVSVFAKDEGHEAHQMSHSGHSGKMIREASVEGYKFAYHLIDLNEQAHSTPEIKEMVMTHHLMVYIQSPQGQPVENATVGYSVKEPGGESQKVMTMGMSGGFGADVKLNAKGAYSITVKAVVEGKTLKDEFEYTVK